MNDSSTHKPLFTLFAIVAIALMGITCIATKAYWKHRCAEQLKQMTAKIEEKQAFLDSVYYAGKLAEKERIVLEKQDQLYVLQQKAIADSIHHLTELQSMRSVINYIRRKR